MQANCARETSRTDCGGQSAGLSSPPTLVLQVEWQPREGGQRSLSKQLRCRLSAHPPIPQPVLDALGDLAGRPLLGSFESASFALHPRIFFLPVSVVAQVSFG